MRQNHKGKRTKAQGPKVRDSSFSLDPLSLHLDPRCSLSDANICARNAVVEDKDSNLSGGIQFCSGISQKD
jgi:hypothetical protein